MYLIRADELLKVKFDASIVNSSIDMCFASTIVSSISSRKNVKNIVFDVRVVEDSNDVKVDENLNDVKIVENRNDDSILD